MLLSPLGKCWDPSFVQTWLLFAQGCLVPSLVEIGPLVLELKKLNLVNVFSLFCYFLPLKKDGGPLFEKIKFPSPKNALCQVWLKLVLHMVLDKKVLLNFRYFVIISPSEMAGPLIWKKLESSSQKNALWQVWLKLAHWLCRKRFFLNFVNLLLSPIWNIWTNLNLHHPSILSAKFSWN